MAVHYTHDQSYVPSIKRPHAPDQWENRTPAELPLVEAWKKSIPVPAPECNADSKAVRLYAPYGALLVVRAGVLRTVLDADDRTELSGLSECGSCGDLVDPLRDASCPWCGASLESAAVAGGVTLQRGGDR